MLNINNRIECVYKRILLKQASLAYRISRTEDSLLDFGLLNIVTSHSTQGVISPSYTLDTKPKVQSYTTPQGD